jgi:hypothetical protein
LLVKATLLFVTAVNFSVCAALCALATAGNASAPAVPKTTAPPAAVMDLRTFMIPLLLCSAFALQEMMRPADRARQGPAALARRHRTPANPAAGAADHACMLAGHGSH